MKKIKHTTITLFFMCLFSTAALAEKHLIFLDGYLGWFYSMPPYLTENYEKMEELPAVINTPPTQTRQYSASPY